MNQVCMVLSLLSVDLKNTLFAYICKECWDEQYYSEKSKSKYISNNYSQYVEAQKHKLCKKIKLDKIH